MLIGSQIAIGEEKTSNGPSDILAQSLEDNNVDASNISIAHTRARTIAIDDPLSLRSPNRAKRASNLKATARPLALPPP